MISGKANSKRMMKDNAAPKIPARKANIRYKVPISLWLVDHNQRTIYVFILIYNSKILIIKLKLIFYKV